MIITNGTLITWDDPNQVLEGQALYVKNGQIKAIGPQGEIFEQYLREEILDAGGQYVMPGNICAHTHFYGALVGWQSLERRRRIFLKSLISCGGLWIVR